MKCFKTESNFFLPNCLPDQKLNLKNQQIHCGNAKFVQLNKTRQKRKTLLFARVKNHKKNKLYNNRPPPPHLPVRRNINERPSSRVPHPSAAELSALILLLLPLAPPSPSPGSWKSLTPISDEEEEENEDEEDRNLPVCVCVCL